MENMKKIGLQLLFPPVWLLVCCCIGAVCGLILVFGVGFSQEWFTIPAYALSFYGLVIFCARLLRDGKKTAAAVKSRIHGIPLLHRYLTDTEFKLHTSLNLSFALNCLYILWKLFYGIRYHSSWFTCLAAYYFLLAVLRFSLLRYGQEYGRNPAGQWKRYRLCGIAFVPLVLTLSFEILLIVREHQGVNYPGYLIYVMAMYAFYKIYVAVRDLIHFRKYHSPVMSAAKGVNFAAALVSMLSLETAMLTQFGAADSELSQRIMTACTGAGVCAMILAMAVYMIFHSTKQLKAAKKETLL